MTCSKCGENVTGFKEAWNDLHEKNKLVCIKESGLEETGQRNVYGKYKSS